jgi:hypothetical protein
LGIRSIFIPVTKKVAHMTSIEPFLASDAVFEPALLQGMAKAFECACRALDLGDNDLAREAVAVRIIALARFGERNPGRLYEKVLSEKTSLA